MADMTIKIFNSRNGRGDFEGVVGTIMNVAFLFSWFLGSVILLFADD